VIEGRDIVLAIAERLDAITRALQIPFIFKSSYDKANRTSVESFRGSAWKRASPSCGR
jgi:2-dehydro-3-deoxyphosphooctonate aldolase (KDO 8-P synthase)